MGLELKFIEDIKFFVYIYILFIIFLLILFLKMREYKIIKNY